MTPNQPAIILINPQLGENIGMVARAMLNCGLTDLRIVNPRDGWPSDIAVRSSAGALDNGVNVRVYNSTADSIADLHFTLATTARPRDMVKDVYTATSAMEATHAKIAKGQNIGVMFGAERTGLENQDVALASAIVTIPLNPDFSSLNLAQATLLIAYEFMIQADATAPIQTNIGKTDIANDGATSQFTERLIDSLNDKNFFKSPDLRPTMERNLTNMIARHQWTAQEIQTLQGILSALARN